MIFRKEAGEKSKTSNIAENSVKIRFFNSYELQVTSHKWRCQIVLFPGKSYLIVGFRDILFTIHYSLFTWKSILLFPSP
jgi:hypothetical protein